MRADNWSPFLAKEIERKFLVNPDHLTTLPTPITIVQGYLSFTPEVRVRVANRQGTLTLKFGSGISRNEFEYTIPERDALELLKECDGRTITKNRYRVQIGKHIWEIDEFRGRLDGLWLAEVELRCRNETFESPGWLVTEVTSNSSFQNASLALSRRRA